MVSIRIKAPLPLDVSSTLLRVIGHLYPDTTLVESAYDEALALEISDADRGVTAEVLAELAELKEMAEGATAEFDIVGTDPESLRTTAGGWLAGILVPAGKALLDSAENYVSQEVIDSTPGGISSGEMELEAHDSSDRAVRYVFSVARSPEQTPHALRRAAEAELDRIRQAVEAAHIPDEVKASILQGGSV